LWRASRIPRRPDEEKERVEAGGKVKVSVVGFRSVAGLAKNKTASEINRVTEKLFQEIHPDKRKTFTCDNGKEFCGHQESREETRSRFLFYYSLSFLGKRIKRRVRVS
jgi:hypothetical protein